MLKIAHRVNTIHGLRRISANLGVEVDIRSQGNGLILHHEPFAGGEPFDEYLKHYHHQFLILNVKTEGIEKRIQELLQQHQINHYFFLDLSLPFLVRLAGQGERRLAVRFSRFEPVALAERFVGLLDWVWLDCFGGEPYLQDEVYAFLKKNFKLCLVSPELQGAPPAAIPAFKKIIAGKKIDAVCTKHPELW